ncbi:MAG: F0F1 ATP synthase subunit B [Intestinibacillus sp.]
MLDAIYQSFVGFSPWELLVTICNTLITFLIVKKFLFKPVRKMMAQREEEVKTMYSEAQTAQTEAEKLRTEYTHHLAKAKEEAASITKSATHRATVRSEEILKEASQQAADMVKKAEASIEQERKKAMNEIKDEITDLSVMIASKVIEKDINENDHKRMIEDFISKVG